MKNAIINMISSYNLINENSYHMYIIGLLSYLYGDYDINADIESGLGRYDIAIIPYNKSKLAYIIEIKLCKSKKDMKLKAEDATKQTEEKKYVTELVNKNIKDIILKLKFLYFIH